MNPKDIGYQFCQRVKDKLIELGAENVTLMPFSGAQAPNKGDLTFTLHGIKFRCEAKKTRGKECWSCYRYDIEKIASEILEGEEPILLFSFQRSEIYVILKLEQLNRLLSDP